MQHGAEIPLQMQHGAEIPLLMQHGAENPLQMQHGAEIPLQIQHGADAEHQQQSKRTIKPSKYSKRVKLASITLDEYMHVFKYLTEGKGNVVQPNCDVKLITGAKLRSVLRLHALPAWNFDKAGMLQSLVGVELWNPYTLPPGPIVPGTITDEEMLEDLRVLQW